jgi:hypothetical protein
LRNGRPRRTIVGKLITFISPVQAKPTAGTREISKYHWEGPNKSRGTRRELMRGNRSRIKGSDPGPDGFLRNGNYPFGHLRALPIPFLAITDRVSAVRDV